MNRLFLTLVVMLLSNFSFAAEDYKLEINGHAYEIGLDKEKDIVLPGGEKLKIRLSLKEYIEFEGRFFSFSHRSTFRPNMTDIGEGIYQTIITTPLGTGIIIQEYTTADPTLLVDMMLRELTKEEVEYGYKYEESTVSKVVEDRKLNGKRAVTTYKDQRWTRSVYAYGKKDAGILIVTFIERESFDEDKHVIDDFWKSLRIKL